MVESLINCLKYCCHCWSCELSFETLSNILCFWKKTELYDRPNRPETLEVEPEEEVDTDEKGQYILQSEMEKAVKEVRNRKATGDDDVPGDVLKLLGEGGLKILTKLIYTHI